jgi:hypothetical protein
MSAIAPDEQLRRARAARGEALDALSRRTGLRVHHLRAIEDGRFGDLPPGIYGRSAIRAYAAAYGLDADAVLTACEPLLPRVEDPIDALARMRGVPVTSTAGAMTAASPAALDWRPLGAASVDGAIAGAELIVIIVAAAMVARVSLVDLGNAAPSLFMLGVALAAGYYVWLGGLCGATVGERAVGPRPRDRDPRPLTLRAIALRARAAATADARAIHALGWWMGRRLTAARTAPPLEPAPSPPPPRGREEALTWSMSRRASVPPPPLHRLRG